MKERRKREREGERSVKTQRWKGNKEVKRLMEVMEKVEEREETK